MIEPTWNPYDELGLGTDCTEAGIKAAYRRESKRAHPDAPTGSADAFARVSLARDVLLDPEKRAHFDRTGRVDDFEALARMEAQVLTAIAGMMDQIIGGELDLDVEDIGSRMRTAMMDTLDNIQADLDKTNRKLHRLERLEAKFRPKKGKASSDAHRTMQSAFQAQRSGLKGYLAQVEHAKALHERVKGVLEAFDYDFEKVAAPSPTGAMFSYSRRFSTSV